MLLSLLSFSLTVFMLALLILEMFVVISVVHDVADVVVDGVSAGLACWFWCTYESLMTLSSDPHLHLLLFLRPRSPISLSDLWLLLRCRM